MVEPWEEVLQLRIPWNQCGSSTVQTHVLTAGDGVTSLYDIPSCIDLDSLSWSPTGSDTGIVITR